MQQRLGVVVGGSARSEQNRPKATLTHSWPSPSSSRTGQCCRCFVHRNTSGGGSCQTVCTWQITWWELDHTAADRSMKGRAQRECGRLEETWAAEQKQTSRFPLGCLFASDPSVRKLYGVSLICSERLCAEQAKESFEDKALLQQQSCSKKKASINTKWRQAAP